MNLPSLDFKDNMSLETIKSLLKRRLPYSCLSPWFSIPLQYNEQYHMLINNKYIPLLRKEKEIGEAAEGLH